MSRAIINPEITNALEEAKKKADKDHFPNLETDDGKWGFIEGYAAAKSIDIYYTIDDLLRLK